ncbi:N-acetylmuramoyl-L-alanine amidase [Streptomyces sp. P01-B04]|nr:N-acetylmuramoyl-L-alanine amidase [Streptomyces poriferorum]MBW5260203.1 N-acetylmuramoyl-L-alanine amidase [Streptomyces poriferorum]
MATPMDGKQFSDAVRSLGVKVIERPGYLQHNREGHGNWGPVNGVLHHHTVTKGTAATVSIVDKGYADLPGPLCHGMIAKNGDLHMIGWGRANHAGLGDPDVLAAVIAETTLPKPKRNTIDGNARFYGFESENLGDGKDPWPAAQLRTMAAVGFVLCRYHKWSERSVIGHLEWQVGKVDPRGPGVSMAGIRKATGALLRPVPKPKPPATAPKPPPVLHPVPLTTEARVALLEGRVAKLEGKG